jgi:peptidoglycan hydrolase CwlO-like protein
LNQKVEEQRTELKQQQTEIAELKQRLDALERIIRNQKPN